MAGLICKHRVPVPHTNLFENCGADAFDTPLGPRCHRHEPPKAPHPNPQRTRAIIECQKLSLDQQERHELAHMLVGHEGSWSTLSEDDARRIADAAQAYLVVQALVLLRRTSHHRKGRRR